MPRFALPPLFAFVFALALCAAPAVAEHRVALLIGNANYDDAELRAPAHDLKQLAAALERYGVRSAVLENLPGEQLKPALEAFAASTPVNSTAIVFFRGRVRSGSENGKPSTFLVGTNARAGDVRSFASAGFSLEMLLERLTSRGGSAVNVVLIDPLGEATKFEAETPAESLLAFLDTAALTAKISGKGDLLAEIRAAAGAVHEELPPGFAVTGLGSAVVAPPEKFSEGKNAGEEWVNSRGMVFCWCPAGTYTAGSPESEPGRYPDEAQREIRIEHGFWISKYELTLAQNLRNHPRDTLAEHKNDPLSMINHDDARTMSIRTLSEEERSKGRLPGDWEYSLPTEEQWEYAARAGTTTRYSFGDDPALLPRYANFGDKSYYVSLDIYSNAAHRTLDDGAVRATRVGRYEPNPWGLHDMHGNLAEWCLNTAIRGGSWVSSPENCRSAYRDSFSSRNEQTFIGYRFVIQRKP